MYCIFSLPSAQKNCGPVLSARPGSFHTASESILFAAIRFFAGPTLITMALTAAAAALSIAALSGIWAAYAGFTPLLCFIQVKYNTAHNTQKNHNYYKILHADLRTSSSHARQPEHIPLSAAYPSS